MKLYFLNRFLLIFILKRFCYRMMNNYIKIHINTGSKIYTIFIISILNSIKKIEVFHE